MITATPSFVPDTVPSPIPLLTVSSDPIACHIPADPTVNESGQSGGPRDVGSISLPSSQIPTLSLSPEVIPSFGLNGTTDIGPLDVPDGNMDSDRRVVFQSLTQPFPDITADSPRIDDHDQSENLV